VTFGIVDVPGHQRFVRNMVAGAIGIDVLLLVVAADDGVMPQTVEHLHIARLLGVQAGVVALNKADLVDEELLELAQADVEELLSGAAASGSPLAHCPIIPVSAQTGAGLPALTAALLAAAAQVKPRHVGDRFRMPVDRSFSIRGAGTVVTGTTLAGQVKLNDELQVLPSGKRARVRGLQVHGQAVPLAGPGRRTAINLTGIEKDDIQRGDVLIEPDSLSTTTTFDAKVELLPGTWRPLRNGSEVLLHIGTSEASAKVQPLDQDTLVAGLGALVQFTLE
jgi:selenocysteine-specific elongation factor